MVICRSKRNQIQWRVWNTNKKWKKQKKNQCEKSNGSYRNSGKTIERQYGRTLNDKWNFSSTSWKICVIDFQWNGASFERSNCSKLLTKSSGWQIHLKWTQSPNSRGSYDIDQNGPIKRLAIILIAFHKETYYNG